MKDNQQLKQMRQTRKTTDIYTRRKWWQHLDVNCVVYINTIKRWHNALLTLCYLLLCVLSVNIHCHWPEVLLFRCNSFLGCQCWRVQTVIVTLLHKFGTVLKPNMGSFCHSMLLRRIFFFQFTFVDGKRDLRPNSLLAFTSCRGARRIIIMLLFAAAQRSAVSIWTGVWLVSLMTAYFMPQQRPLSSHRAAPLTSCWGILCPMLPKAYWCVTCRPRLFNELKLDTSIRSQLLHPLSHSQSSGARVLWWTEQEAGSPERLAIFSVRLRPKCEGEEFFIYHGCQVTWRTEMQRAS